MSKFSPAIVDDSEQLSRFVFSPIHVGKSGKLKPSLFSHVATKGCSIQRDTRATQREISEFVVDFLNYTHDRNWFGVVSARCDHVRSIKLDDRPERALCVYDTAEKQNPAHAEICQTRFAADEGDVNEIRRHMMEQFDADNLVAPPNYRNGEVWASLTPELRARLS